MKALAHGTLAVAIQRIALVSTKEQCVLIAAIPVPFMKYPG